MYFWLSENALFGLWGMISGAFILSFFLLPLGSLYRFLLGREKNALIALLFSLPLAFTIHKTAFLLVLPLALAWTIRFSLTLQTRDLVALLIAALFTGLINFHWLYPFFKLLPLKVEDPATTFFQNTDPFRIFTDLWPFPPHPHYGLPHFRLLLLAFGAVGLIKARRQNPGLFLALLSGLAFLGAFSYFGSFLPSLRHLQPYRYVTAYFYFWLAPAAIGIIAVHERLRQRRGPRTAAAGRRARARAARRKLWGVARGGGF
jgi:hypothetical protein